MTTVVSQEAQAVHEAACIIDLHADTPKLISRGYDLRRRHRTPWPVRRWLGHVDLPRLQEGGVAAQFFGMWTFPKPERGCNAEVHRQLDALTRAISAGEGIALCSTAEEIRRCRARGMVAALCGIEGGQALEAGGYASEAATLEQLKKFAERKVRYLGLLHFSRNALGAPAMGWGMDPAQGLTPLGCAVVDACRELGMLVDLAHINRRGFFDAVSRRPGPLLVSHTGVAGVHRHWRNIDDEQIRAVADSGGVVGVIFAPRYLGRGGVEGVVDHLMHIIRVAGEDAVALGSDWDGFVQPPQGLADPSELPHLTEALLRRRLSAQTIHKLLGGNVLRMLDEVGPLRLRPLSCDGTAAT
ncbi:MAG: membrane dipeptidase [Myxococcales bacterium]|nr:membrane dipeptidase [Myxococcota bacterium]MDW8281783.1 membrane dipeptidase [Myxococcales bacterium]